MARVLVFIKARLGSLASLAHLLEGYFLLRELFSHLLEIVSFHNFGRGGSGVRGGVVGVSTVYSLPDRAAELLHRLPALESAIPVNSSVVSNVELRVELIRESENKLPYMVLVFNLFF